MALVSLLSGGYNLHRFSDVIGLVLVCYSPILGSAITFKKTIAFVIFSLNMLTYFLHPNSYLLTFLLNTICRAQLLCPFLLLLLL